MTPTARVQSAIDLLDEIIASARDGGAAADVIATRFFKARRYAGSKDRRAVRDLAWRAIRRFGERPKSGRMAILGLAKSDKELAALFEGDGTGHGPAGKAEGEPVAKGGALPGWIIPLLAEPFRTPSEQTALLERAPLDLRVNPLKGTVEDAIAAFPEAERVAGLPLALRLPTDHAMSESDAAITGLVEVQDAGSQWIVAACRPHAGMTMLDLCAGAGGKTLALAALAGSGKGIFASDTDRRRLQQLRPRAERAGVPEIREILLNPGQEAEALARDLPGTCDLVLIDAPCSGSGTWRRNPETRWRLTPARLNKIVSEQARLLDIAAPLVARGGALVYAVCSPLDREGADQAAAFLDRHTGWKAAEVAGGRAHGAGRLLSPERDGCDGFFFTRFERL